MTRSEATELARKIAGTWRGGPSVDVWAEVLEEMHRGQAEHARQLLRDELDSAPSVPEFRRRYRSLAEPERHSGCNDCDGHGWLHIVEKHHGHDYECSAPCRCPAGRANAKVHQAVIRANDQELGRILPGRDAA